MKFDIKKHIYLILLFILPFTVKTAQSQEVTNIHIAVTDTVPLYKRLCRYQLLKGRRHSYHPKQQTEIIKKRSGQIHRSL